MTVNTVKTLFVDLFEPCDDIQDIISSFNRRRLFNEEISEYMYYYEIECEKNKVWEQILDINQLMVGYYLSLIDDIKIKFNILSNYDIKINITKNILDIWIPIDGDKLPGTIEGFKNDLDELTALTRTYSQLLKLPNSSLTEAFIKLIEMFCQFVYDKYSELTFQPSIEQSEKYISLRSAEYKTL